MMIFFESYMKVFVLNTLIKRTGIILFFLMYSLVYSAQNTPLNCPRNIVAACNAPCFELNVTIPNIKSQSSDYYLNPNLLESCYNSPMPTQLPGTLANLTIDDRYSAVINLPFQFNFYGQAYNSLIVSTNGYISFDVSKANLFSHFAILTTTGTTLSAFSGTGVNLPSNLYDRALIMAPYHDLNPALTTSPTQHISYGVVGTSPNRKFVVTTYRVPLFGTGCSNLFENIHQIVLYEGLNIIDVFIDRKQICNVWNDGRSLVGIQNFNRDKGINVPLRTATDPAWGVNLVKERYRFIPKDGDSRFDKVELTTLSNVLVAVGDTSSIDANNLNARFQNVCLPTGVNSAQYLLKTYYKVGSGATADVVMFLDTINVSNTPVTPQFTTTSSACGASTGSITVTNILPNSTTSYAINGGTPQASNVFTGLSAGTYNVTVFLGQGCSTSGLVVVSSGNTLPVSASQQNPSCNSSNDGSIIVNASSANQPLEYRIDNGPYQNSNVFSGLTAGTYTYTVRDAVGCIGSGVVALVAGPALTANVSQTNPTCFGFTNGSITVTPNGAGPFEFSINGSAFAPGNGVFNNLGVGTYSINFRNTLGCTGNVQVILTQAASINTNITNVMPKCFGSLDGSITVAANGGTPNYQYSLNGGNFQNSPVFNNLGDGMYTIITRDGNGCQKVDVVELIEPDELFAFAFDDSTTCFGNDGSIEVLATGGTTPYQYSINNINFQTSNIFNNISVGSYNNIVVRDFNGCQATTSAIVSLKDTMFLNAGNDTVICKESSYTMQPITNNATNIFSWISLPASQQSTITNANNKNAIVKPNDTTIYVLNAQWGLCSRTDTIKINVLAKPQAIASNDTIICHKDSSFLRGRVNHASGPVTYTWLPANKVTVSVAQNTIGIADSSIAYILKVNDNYGCNFTTYDTVLVTMRPKVPAFAGNDTIAATNVPHKLLGSGGVSYQWTPTWPLNNPNSDSPTAILPYSMSFSLLVKNDIGCKGYDTVNIKVYDGPTYYTPNAFTPNGDGLNDVFRPIPVAIQTRQYFRVYNRFGELVFETTEWLKGWDGKLNGKLQPQGTYVWVVQGIDKFGKVRQFKGSVLLLNK